MAKVNNSGQRTGSGYHTKSQINKVHPEARARDRIAEAFAGDENESSYKDPQDTRLHSTSVKSRRTKHSATKTPIR